VASWSSCRLKVGAWDPGRSASCSSCCFLVRHGVPFPAAPLLVHATSSNGLVVDQHALNQRGEDGFVQRCELYQACVQPLQLCIRHAVEIDARSGFGRRALCNQRRRISAARGSISASEGGSRVRRVARRVLALPDAQLGREGATGLALRPRLGVPAWAAGAGVVHDPAHRRLVYEVRGLLEERNHRHVVGHDLASQVDELDPRRRAQR
jgi:hypothetical protein